LWLGKQVDNQVSISLNPIQHNHIQTSASNFTPSKSDESKKDKSADQMHKLIVPFPNKLKNN